MVDLLPIYWTVRVDQINVSDIVPLCKNIGKITFINNQRHNNSIVSSTTYMEYHNNYYVIRSQLMVLWRFQVETGELLPQCRCLELASLWLLQEQSKWATRKHSWIASIRTEEFAVSTALSSKLDYICPQGNTCTETKGIIGSRGVGGTKIWKFQWLKF